MNRIRASILIATILVSLLAGSLLTRSAGAFGSAGVTAVVGTADTGVYGGLSLEGVGWPAGMVVTLALDAPNGLGLGSVTLTANGNGVIGPVYVHTAPDACTNAVVVSASGRAQDGSTIAIPPVTVPLGSRPNVGMNSLRLAADALDNFIDNGAPAADAGAAAWQAFASQYYGYQQTLIAAANGITGGANTLGACGQ